MIDTRLDLYYITIYHSLSKNILSSKFKIYKPFQIISVFACKMIK